MDESKNNHKKYKEYNKTKKVINRTMNKHMP